MDVLGYLPETVYRIHAAFLSARGIVDPHLAEKAFVRQMGAHKLPLLEAAMVWRCITATYGSKPNAPYRKREVYGMEDEDSEPGIMIV